MLSSDMSHCILYSPPRTVAISVIAPIPGSIHLVHDGTRRVTTAKGIVTCGKGSFLVFRIPMNIG